MRSHDSSTVPLMTSKPALVMERMMSREGAVGASTWRENSALLGLRVMENELQKGATAFAKAFSCSSVSPGDEASSLCLARICMVSPVLVGGRCGFDVRALPMAA